MKDNDLILQKMFNLLQTQQYIRNLRGRLQRAEDGYKLCFAQGYSGLARMYQDRAMKNMRKLGKLGIEV